MSRRRASERAWILAGLALAAGAIMAASLLRRRLKLPEDARILMFGDSMAQGLDPHLAALAKEAGIPFKAVYKVGTRIDQWPTAELDAAFESFNPNFVIIVLGTNDFYSQKSHEQIAADAEKLLEWLEKKSDPTCYGLGPAVLWVSPPLLQIFDAPYPELEAETDQYEGCGGSQYFNSAILDLRMGADHIHPTAAGFASWAGAIWQAIS